MITGYTTDDDGNCWKTSELEKAIHFVDHMCESAHSFSSSINASESTSKWGFQERKENDNLTLIDDPDDDLNKKKIIPFFKKVKTNLAVLNNKYLYFRIMHKSKVSKFKKTS